MNVHCIGINHRTAPIEIREKLWFSADEARSFLSMFQKQFADECVLISTCNRTELYYVAKQSPTGELPSWKIIAAFKGLEGSFRAEHFYVLSSLHAIHHLYKLASGIDSMVLGDVQIISQIKNAFALAKESGCVGSVLHRAFTQALHTGKCARSQTEIGEGATSVGYASSELIAKIFGDLSQRKALLIGAGETGEITAKHLHSNNLGRLFIANRTRERAEALSRRLGATTIDYSSCQLMLSEIDIVITSVSTDDHILNMHDFQQAMKMRNKKPLVVIDLGVPRNVDPKAGLIENLFLHDIDGLQHIVTQNLGRRRKEIPKVQQIILGELNQFEQWNNARELTPTIQDLQKRFEEIRSSEVERMHARFSPDVNEEIAMITKRIVNKILHAPMVNLKSQSRKKETKKIIDQLRFIFGLDTPPIHHSDKRNYDALMN